MQPGQCYNAVEPYKLKSFNNMMTAVSSGQAKHIQSALGRRHSDSMSEAKSSFVL